MEFVREIYRQIIKRVNVSLGFISKWNNKFLIGGVKGLRMAYKGKHGYLSKSEKAEIILWLSQREMWDLAELAIYIEDKYEVIYHHHKVTILYLNQLSFSGKVPKEESKETPNW
jgi:putative transposase